MVHYIYTIHWTTGDFDICYGSGELHRVVRELGYRIDGGLVKDGDKVCGSISGEEI